MTFEEWWHENESALRFGIDFIAHRVLTGAELKESNEQMKRIANDVWQASQPKWTLCKDGLPDNDSWVLVYMPETEDFEAMICTAYYTSGDWQSEWDTNQHPISAWMPLPEAPGNIDK